MSIEEKVALYCERERERALGEHCEADGNEAFRRLCGEED